MQANVHYLHGEPSRIGLFLRLSHTGHRKLEDILASDRHQISSVVVEAANLGRQKALVKSLQTKGAEVVLDTNVAELASLGRYDGGMRSLPWACLDGRPWSAADFNEQLLRDHAKMIAEYAVVNDVDAVLAPGHLLRGANDYWLHIDQLFCQFLREELGASGASYVRLDRQLLMPYSVFRNSAQRKAILSAIASEEFDNLWIRVGDLGADATASGLREYHAAALDLHSLGKPVVADYIGGIIGLSLAATGAIGGMSHGVATKERLYLQTWMNPSGKGGASKPRVYFPEIDSYLSTAQAQELLKARHAKSLLGCRDASCCAMGSTDMIGNPEAHFLTQRLKEISALGACPRMAGGRIAWVVWR